MKIRGIAIVEKMISINKQLTVAGEVRKLLRPVSRAFSMLLVKWEDPETNIPWGKAGPLSLLNAHLAILENASPEGSFTGTVGTPAELGMWSGSQGRPGRLVSAP